MASTGIAETKAVTETNDHKAAVREEFTRQAQAYAAAAVITDADRLARLVNAIDPVRTDRALEIATWPRLRRDGPGRALP